jgi:signal transduction histidine kinase
MTGTTAIVATGRIDREGRLVAASRELLSLQQAAGAGLFDLIAVPAIASVSRLALRLGILVSRRAVAAVEHQIVEFLIRAHPDGDGVVVELGEGQALAPPPWMTGEDPNRAQDFAELESEGNWACDADLRITAIDGRLAAFSGLAPDSDDPPRLTGYFRLLETETGDLPLLDGVAGCARFCGQKAELRAIPGLVLLFHAQPAGGGGERFGGFRGGYRIVRLPAEVEPALASTAPLAAATESSDFSGRLDLALRQPLARIIANADQIARQASGPLRSDYAGYARDIAAAGRHLLGLVDDLSDLRAVESADFRAELEPVDLGDIARRAAGLLAVRAADRGVRIDPPAADETLMARGDFRRLLQIMVNLVGNAVRYSPEGAGVWIRLEQEADLAVVIVADQGKGIAVADQERIFGKFERVDAAEPGGSGLGLFISRRLARAMGGDLTVDSAPGQGARFALTLPTAPR